MRISYEDDLVKVKNVKTGSTVYKGYEDDEPLKNEDWQYNEIKGLYELSIYHDGKEFNFTKKNIG